MPKPCNAVLKSVLIISKFSIICEASQVDFVFSKPTSDKSVSGTSAYSGSTSSCTGIGFAAEPSGAFGSYSTVLSSGAWISS